MPYIKISNEVWRIDDFGALARKLSFLPTYYIYLSRFDWLSCIISNSDKHEFNSIWNIGLAVVMTS